MDAALSDFSQAIKLNPKCPASYFRRGGAYMATGDTDAAIADFSQLIQLAPNDARGYECRAVVYMAKKPG